MTKDLPQYQVWEEEYKNPKLITNSEEPSNDFKRFLKFLKKDRKINIEGLKVLDLGLGTGKNAIFLAERGAHVIGLEISDTALKTARSRAQATNVDIEFIKHDIGTAYPFPNESFDLVIDIMSSNSLNNKGRGIYLKEVNRILRPDGYFFVRGLCKDGDKHAQNLLKDHAGKEKDTYIIPEFGLVERVFSEQNFREMYGQYFSIISLTKKTSYAQFKGKAYKRNYWLGYMQKLE